MVDFHHIANPLFNKALDLQEKDSEECVDLFLTSFKGFYLSFLNIGGMEYLRVEKPLFSPTLIKDKFWPRVIDGLTQDQEIKDIIESSDSLYGLSQKTNIDELFINIKADKGLLDYLLGVEFEHKGVKMNYDDKNFTLEFNNKESAKYFLNAVRLYKRALDSPTDMPEMLIKLRYKSAFDNFSIYGLKEKIKECTEHYFQVTGEPARELTDDELNANVIPARELWKSI